MEYPSPNWMASLNEHTIWTDVVLPSTHNSGTAWIEYFHPMPDTKQLMWTFPACHFISEWTCCQSVSLALQLHMGVRCFDFRISFDGRRPWITHTYTCMPLETAFNVIDHYLFWHPLEYVVVRMKEDYEHRGTMTPEAIQEVLGLVDSFEDMLIQDKDQNKTIRELRMAHHRLALFWLGDAAIPEQDQHLFLNKNMLIGHWANANTIDLLRSNIESVIASRHGRSTDCLAELSFTLTPRAEDIKQAIIREVTCRGRTNLETYAQECKNLLGHWDRTQLESSANIISVDHADEEIVRFIFMLNFEE